MVVLLALENYLVFHPLKASEEWLEPPNQRIQDVALTAAQGIRLHGWWCPAANPRGIVLYCHGNAGNLSHRRDEIACWQSFLQQSVFIFDYPGYGRSEGKPSEAGCYEAGEAAYNWLVQSQSVPARDILIFGRSLGGGVAVELALNHPHRALVLASGFTSVPAMAQSLYPWLPARWLVRTQFNNLAKIGRVAGPVFVAHGDGDTLVPISHGQELFQAACNPKEFLTLAGQDHNAPLGARFYQSLAVFLDLTAQR
jgi:fermentation-respiration switch protein FrsA (DUF1100 family)